MVFLVFPSDFVFQEISPLIPLKSGKKVTGYVKNRSKTYQDTSLYLCFGYLAKPIRFLLFRLAELSIERFAGVLDDRLKGD